MAETMTALVERNRAHLAAYSAASQIEGWDSKAEDAFLSSADLAAGNTIENDPPRLRDKGDLVAAISYVAEDVDFLQKGHGRVLARVLEYLTAPEPSTVSQRANALLGFYIATEREQVRLAALGETAAEAALSAKALEARDALLALRDRAACPDLIGARILVNLMLRHYWHGPDAPVWDEDDRAEALPMLEILSDRLTGEARRQAAFVLGTIGVEVAPEAPTPFALRMAAFRQDCDRYNTATTDDDGPNPDEALFADLNAGKVTLASASDAAEAMRYVLGEDVIEDVLSEQMARCVLAFLEGKGPTQNQPGGANAESIESMTRRLRAHYDRDHTEETEAEFDAQYARFLELQTRIIRAAPVTPRDVALQYFADNHFGASDTSNEFDDVLRTLSGMEWP